MVRRGYMKYLLVVIILLLNLKNSFSQNEIIVKQIDFRLDVVSNNSYENEFFMTLKFTKGIKYIFKVQNHLEDFAGEAVVELNDADNLVLTNLYTGKYFDQFAFMCNKTGFYDILVKYRDNKIGHSKVDIFMVQ